MSTQTTADGSVTDRGGFWRLPATGLGWWAMALTISIFPVAWVLVTHAIPWSLFDTAFAPILLTALMVAAAVVSMTAWRNRQDRTAPVFVSAILAVPLAVLAVLVLISEVLFPH